MKKSSTVFFLLLQQIPFNISIYFSLRKEFHIWKALKTRSEANHICPITAEPVQLLKPRDWVMCYPFMSNRSQANAWHVCVARKGFLEHGVDRGQLYQDSLATCLTLDPVVQRLFTFMISVPMCFCLFRVCQQKRSKWRKRQTLCLFTLKGSLLWK